MERSTRINAGKLRHKVAIQSLTTTKNDIGEMVETYAPTKYAWASIEPATGRELFIAQQYQAEVTSLIRIRYIDGITPRTKIEHRGRTFNVAVVVNVEERNIALELLCKEVV